MKKASKSILILMSIILGISVIACAAEPVTITFMGWGSPLERANVEEAVKVFNQKNPEINVKWIHVPADYETKLFTMVAGGNAPDVFWGGIDIYREYAYRGLLLDITDQVKNDPIIGKPGYFVEPWEEERCAIEGRWYGIGSCWTLIHMFYNKEVFDEAGAEYPPVDPDKAWDWSHFVEIAQKLTSKADSKWGAYIPTAWWMPYDPFIASNGGEYVNKEGKVALDEPEAVEALQQIADLTNKLQVAPYAVDLQKLGLGAWQMLATGRLGMLVDGSWALQDISKLGFKFGCAALPKFKVPVTTMQAHLHVIYKDTKHPEEAWEFLRFLASDYYQLSLCKVGLWLPSHSSLFTPEGLEQWITPEVHPEGYANLTAKYMDKYARILYMPIGWRKASVSIISPGLEPLWLGKKTAQECVNEMVPKANATLAKELERIKG